ncbi:MAG TPA: FAD-binding protein, partial [Alphaproteobacteria bacterium]|nr:FAD-binding protein [Alphaproteobacteria bacterium]
MRAIERLGADVLVIGGGIAGIQAAVAAARQGARVAIAYTGHGASPYVLGVNAPLAHEDPSDTPALYVDDMLRGGYGLNDRRLVRVFAEEAAAAALELAALGVPFARYGDRFRQRHLSGNSCARSLYVPEGTGRAILDALTKAADAAGVTRFSGYRALRLVCADGAVVGALLHSRQKDVLLAVNAGAVILAAGGIGRIYEDSTYPVDVAADSCALALEAGAVLIDMEFVQFEPTVTVYPEACRGVEMPTAMLGDGAHLINAVGERFMLRYNPDHAEKRIEKARLALCIQREIDEGRGFADRSVAFDTTRLDRVTLEGYVTHVKRLRAAGLDPAREAPRVRPAAHSIMGGVRIDAACRTDVPGLLACGEASGGIHGASRLAGNGGGEIITFGRIAGRCAGTARSPDIDPVPLARAALDALREVCRRASGVDHADAVARLGARLTSSCGLYRERAGLESALAELREERAAWRAGVAADSLDELAANRSMHNRLLAAETIVAAALRRTESRGG